MRAEVGDVPAVQPARPQRVLLALDGSSQDELSAAIVSRLKERLGCEVGTVNALEAPAPPSESTAAAIGEKLRATQLAPQPGESTERILAAIDDWKADLLVVPCPFGRDFQEIGSDSTGTVIDLLLARSPVPLIATRAPFDPQGDVFSRLRMVLSGENEAAPAAARWAAGLVHPHGHLELYLVVQEEFYENVREAMHSIDPDAEISLESLENALAKTHARLHVGLQRAASEQAFHYKLVVCSETEAEPLTVADPSSHPPLLVFALERADHASQGHVHDGIRRSPYPVLVVPG